MRTHILDPDEARELVARHGGIRPAARATGYSFGAIHGALNRGGHVADADIDEGERTEAKLREEIKKLNHSLTQARREAETTERIREFIYELSAKSPEPPVWLGEKTAPGVPGLPMVTWSDWHWDEVVNAEEVGYVNEFNAQIQSDRAQLLTEKVIAIANDHMVNPDFPGIVVNLGGDMITGEIHIELSDTNYRYVPQTMLDLQDTLAAALERLADTFKRVFVVCVVGNHGRMYLKPRMKGRAYSSFEWNVYCQLERYFRNDDRIQFLIPGEADAHYRVYSHRFVLTHGDSLGVKGGDGIIGSLGPIKRGAIKVGRSEAAIGRDFDTLIMGHWHQLMFLKGIHVNGSLKGYDEFARLALRADYERPQQALWFQHPKHGVTAQWPIYLDKLRTDDRPWVSWQENVTMTTEASND